MNSITLSTGRVVQLDGDLLSMIEALYEEVALRRELQHSYDDLTREIDHLLAQIAPEDLRRYFKESLFLNTVTYENEMLDAYARRLQEGEKS